MDRAIGDEIGSIREELNRLNTKVLNLELRFDQAKKCEVQSIERVEKSSSDLVFDNTVTVKRSKTSEPKDTFESVPEYKESEEVKAKEVSGQTLEEKIGSYWLNRVGIFSLVIGLALLLMYSFQFYGPVFKVITGLLIGFGLVAGGEWMISRGEPSWYVRGLIGGGWSISFFTAFALYHVPAVKLTDSLLLDCFLMSAVCLLAMAHAIWRRSELIAGLACVLTLIVISLADINQFSFCAQAILIIALAYMSSRFDWYKLFFWGVIASYGTFYFSLNPKIVALNLSDWGNLITTFSYVGVLWLVFNLSVVSLKTYSRNRKVRLISAAFVNALGFIPLIGGLLKPLIGSFDWVYPLLIAAVYFALYMVTRKRKLTGLDDLHMLVALSSLTHSIALLSGASNCNLYWMLEIPALVWLGLRYQIVSMRTFALLLAFITGVLTLLKAADSTIVILMGQKFSAATFHFLWFAISAAVTAGIIRVPSRLNDYGKSYSNTFYIYLLAAAAYFFMLPVLALDLMSGGLNFLGVELDASSFKISSNMTFWTFECAILLTVGFLARDRHIKYGVCTASAFLALSTILSAKQLPDPVLLLVIAFFALSMLTFRKVYDIVNSRFNKNQFYFYFSCLAFLIWCLAMVKFTSDFLSLRWAIEAFVLVLLGFWFSDENIRAVGGVIFATAAFNLLAISSDWLLWDSLSVVTLLYFTASMYRLVPLFDGKDEHRHYLAHVYEVAAASLLTMFVGRNIPANWITFAWSVEGLAFLAAGFLINDKVFRISGLSVFGLVALKLLFVDLAGQETIARIFSFIVAGVVLLIASYAYTKFTSRYMNISESK